MKIKYNEIYDIVNFNGKPDSTDFPSGLSTNLQIIANVDTTIKKK